MEVTLHVTWMDDRRAAYADVQDFGQVDGNLSFTSSGIPVRLPLCNVRAWSLQTRDLYL